MCKRVHATFRKTLARFYSSGWLCVRACGRAGVRACGRAGCDANPLRSPILVSVVLWERHDNRGAPCTGFAAPCYAPVLRTRALSPETGHYHHWRATCGWQLCLPRVQWHKNWGTAQRRRERRRRGQGAASPTRMSSLLSPFLRPFADAGWHGHRVALSARARQPPVVSGGHAGRQGTRVVQAGTARAQDDTRERRCHRRALEQSHRGVDGAAVGIAPIPSASASDWIGPRVTSAAANSALSLASATGRLDVATAAAAAAAQPARRASGHAISLALGAPSGRCSWTVAAAAAALAAPAAARDGALDHSGRRRLGRQGAICTTATVTAVSRAGATLLGPRRHRQQVERGCDW